MNNYKAFCASCWRDFRDGEIAFHSKHQPGFYICQKCLERENMPNTNIKITAEVNGKQVPLENISNETFRAIKAAARTEEISIPVARIGHYRGESRLFLTLTNKLKDCIATSYVRTVAINLKTGDPTNDWRTVRENLPLKYRVIRPL